MIFEINDLNNPPVLVHIQARADGPPYSR
jgi:hypothetical protein